MERVGTAAETKRWNKWSSKRVAGLLNDRGGDPADRRHRHTANRSASTTTTPKSNPPTPTATSTGSTPSSRTTSATPAPTASTSASTEPTTTTSAASTSPPAPAPSWVKTKKGADALYQRRNNSTRQVPAHETETVFITERSGLAPSAKPRRQGMTPESSSCERH